MTTEWCFELVETPKDGSCFFASISHAMNECTDEWYRVKVLRDRVEKYWDAYHEETGENLTEVTQRFVRFMCAKNIDKDIMEMHNAEAEYRKDTGEKGVKIFKTVKEFQNHVINTKCWADHSIFLAFHRSLGYRCSLIVFDSEVEGIPYLDKEWTEKKDIYICLRRENNHYSTVRLVRGEKRMKLCVSRKTIVDMVRDLNSTMDDKITLVL